MNSTHDLCPKTKNSLDENKCITKGFPFYGVKLTYADSAHFWIWSSQLSDQNSKIYRICISQSDAIERKPFTQEKLRVYCPNIYIVFSFQLGGAAANRVSQWLWNFHAKDSKFGLSFVFKVSNACRLYVNEVNLIYENNCHCHFVNNTGGLQLVRFQLVQSPVQCGLQTALNSAIHRFSAVFSQRK